MQSCNFDFYYFRFRRNFFSDKNGKVKAYAIIVAEDYLKPTDSKPSLPKWQDVQQFSPWIPYQVSDPLPHLFNNATEAEYVIGTENCNQQVRNKEKLQVMVKLRELRIRSKIMY